MIEFEKFKRKKRRGANASPDDSLTLRNDQIIRLREAGFTYTSIAKKFGLSRERIRQIYLGSKS